MSGNERSSGSDVIYGGEGPDVLFGEQPDVNRDFQGPDVLYGGDGNDRLKGQGDNDVLYGDDGDDGLNGGDGINANDGRNGFDQCLSPTSAEGALNCEG